MDLKIKNFKLLLLLLTIIASTTSSTPVLGLSMTVNEEITTTQLIEPTIINFSHIPFNPLPNQLITIYTILSFSSIDITNVTLAYQINGSGYNRVVMNMTNNNQYEYDLPGQNENSIIFYRIELFVNNSLTDQKPAVNFAEIRINLQNNFITIIPQQIIILNPAEYVLTSQDSTVIINLDISNSVEISFDKIERSQVQDLQSHISLSDLLIIEINDSEALISANLTINYDPILINEYQALESSLKLLTREKSSYEWSEHPSIVDEVSNKIIANVSHFSEWIVASPNPVLRLTEVDNPEVMNLGSIGSINTIGSNVGNIRADNVTLSIFFPIGIFLNNESSVYKSDILYPLENVSVIWTFYADKLGFYSIVLVFESQNADNDILEIHFEVVEENIDSKDSENSKSPWNFSINTIVFTLTLLFLYKKKKLNHQRK